MKYKLFTQMLTGLFALTLGTTAATEPGAAQRNNKFFCGISEGVPATMVRTSNRNVPIIIWVDRGFELSGWTPERRCQEVSGRFQRYHSQGILAYIRTGTVHRHPVLCVTNYQGGVCQSDRVLITLKPGSDAQFYLDSLIGIRNGSGAVLQLNEGEVFSYDENRELYANVEEWIKELSVEEGNSQPVQPVEEENSQDSETLW